MLTGAVVEARKTVVSAIFYFLYFRISQAADLIFREILDTCQWEQERSDHEVEEGYLFEIIIDPPGWLLLWAKAVSDDDKAETETHTKLFFPEY